MVSRNNGVGLTTDMDLLTKLLSSAGNRVHRVDWRVPRIPKCDVVIFVELFNPNLLKFAQKSVGIFNPEWFMVAWSPWVAKLDQVWAKSRMAEEIFLEMNPNTHYTGFLSKNLNDGSVVRKPTVVHVQGHSSDKNTERVLETWRNNSDLPKLTVITQKGPPIPPGVTRFGRLPERTLKHVLNENDIHLCPSRVEGWGHYISEALTVGAHVITTDMSPMNEHVRPEWGTLISPSHVEPRGVAQACDVTVESIATAVRDAVSIPPDVRTRQRYAAQAHMAQRNAQFAQLALKLIEE
ncbi:glycosyltransferase [Rhodococcus qingshengii]|uniref:glycosyltransferase n=1 Tax=Rhodococcus qingshengii TaxID=334542 RepID=UPI0035D52DF3